MKLSIPPINPQFVYDQEGNKKAVLLDIKEFDNLVEGLEDFYDLMRVYKIKQEGAGETFNLKDVIEEILARKNDCKA